MTMIPKIYIDPGHSSVDPGAVGYEVERDLNEKVSKFQNEHLLANYVCETKVGDISINSVRKVAEEANAWGANFLCSNHFNAGGGDGYEALVYSSARVELGRIFEKHVKAIGQNSRGVKLRPDLGVLRISNMPAILNEGAFVDNLKDIQDWNDDAELKKLGIAYAEATAEYMKLEKKNGAPVEEETTNQPKEESTVNVTLSVLRKGSESEEVKALQRMLYAMGYNLGTQNPIDGDFGSKTDTAVRAYQKSKGLTVDGIVGAMTWTKLLKG